jgi:hypothetical protein
MVSVHDVAGRSVFAARLVNRRFAVLDLRRLSAGVYLVKLTADGYSGTQKLVVQR